MQFHVALATRAAWSYISILSISG